MDDLISREALLDVMQKEGIWGYFEEGWMEQEIEDIIKGLPSMGKKKAKWLAEAGDDAFIGYWRCSECKKPYPSDTPFCPWCGAEME